MKTKLFTYLIAPALLGLCVLGGPANQAKQASAAGGTVDFFNNTGDTMNYGGYGAMINYQYENGKELLSNNIRLGKTATGWESKVGSPAATVVNHIYSPGENGLQIKWTALTSGVVHVKGIVYNAYSFSSTEDLSAYGVAAREEGASLTRDGVKLSATWTSGEFVYEFADQVLADDYKLFVDFHNNCHQGDTLTLTINGLLDHSEDEVAMYVDYSIDAKVLSYDMLSATDFKRDLFGSGNEAYKNSDATIVTDPVKGVHFGAGAGNDNLRYLYDYHYNQTDFTDYLTDFSIHIRFTIEGELNDWAYIFSTTSHETQPGTDFAQSTKGIALGLNAMSDGSGVLRDSNNRLRYCLKIHANEKGGDFYFPTNGWINDLVDGGTYDAYINVSSSAKFVECFCYGLYNNGAGDWYGTNSSPLMTLADNWTMNNPGYHGLTLGCFNEGGEQQFHGYIGAFEVNRYYYSFTTNNVTGPFRDSTMQYVTATSTAATNAIAFEPKASNILANAQNAVNMSLSNGASFDVGITWVEVVADSPLYYAVGLIPQVNGLNNSVCQTVMAPINTTDLDAARAFAENFLAKLTCDATGATAPVISSGTWADLENGLTADQILLLKAMEYEVVGDTIVPVDLAEQRIVDALAKYDYIIAKYGTSAYSDFLNRISVNPFNGNQNVQSVAFNSTINATLIIVAASMILLVSLFFLIKRVRVIRHK